MPFLHRLLPADQFRRPHPTIDGAVTIHISARDADGTQTCAEYIQPLMVSGRQIGCEEMLPLMTAVAHTRVSAKLSFAEGDDVIHELSLADITVVGRVTDGVSTGNTPRS